MLSVFGSLVDEAEIENVKNCMNSQWMGFGKYVDIFEDEYKKKFNLSSFAMVDSGSNALYLAVKLLDLPENSEIILPSFTWVACAQAIILAGHIPVFCDVDLKTMNVRLEDVEPLLNEKTGAIMVVHYAGLPVDLDPIIELGYPIIEDAAHALDSTYKGKPCGNIGDIGIYSFDAVKNLTVGEGGGITSRFSEKIERAKIMRYCGIGKSGFDSATDQTKKSNKWWEYNIQETSIKMLPTNLSANIGLAQLEKIDKLQARRKNIWEYYQKEFNNLEIIKKPQDIQGNDRHSYFTYCIRVPKRDDLANYLLTRNIYTTLRYHPLHLNKIFMKYRKFNLNNSEQLNNEALSIPIHPRLSDGDVEYICAEIKNFFNSKL